MNTRPSVFQALHLNKKYKSREVVKDVSISIRRGEVVGLLGPNGAGKTTSFYMMVGLVAADGGSIFLDDVNITKMPTHLRARNGISYLPQEASIFRKLTVAQNIMAILELRPELTKVMRQQLLEQLLNEFRLSHVAHTIGMSLSGGERRRTEIARTLATEPSFVLLDEPFAGIDPISVLDVKRIIHHLQKKEIGVLITDHNVRETLSSCSRAYIVNAGQIICEGDPEKVLLDENVRAVYLGDEFAL